MDNNEMQFDEPTYRMSPRQVHRNLFVDFLIKRGWAKDEQQAVYILLGVAAVASITAIWLFMFGGNSDVQEESALLIEETIKNTNAPYYR